MSNPFQPIMDWAYSNPELDKKVALNQLVHRTLDRGLNRRIINAEKKTPASEIKSALMTPAGDRSPEQDNTLKRFQLLQKGTAKDGLKRGWTPEEREKYFDKYGSYPGANDYSPGDQEYNKRIRGIALTEALMGPAQKSKMIGTAQGAVQGTYNPRDKAYDDYINNPKTRPLLTQNEDGTYSNAENIDTVMDNYHMGAGRVLKPLGQRGYENMHRYYNSRGEEDESTAEAFLKGTGELLLDSGKAIGRWAGFDIPRSERDQAVQNALAAQWLSDSGTQMFDEQDMELLEDGTTRQELAEAYESLGEQTAPMSVPDSFKLATGRMPNGFERLYNETLPMLADYSTAVAPLAAATFGQKGFVNALKAGAAMGLRDMLLEEIPTNVPLTGASILATGQQEKGMDELREIAKQKQQTHQQLADPELDFVNRAYKKLSKPNQMQ